MNRLYARTNAEAHVFMDQRPCACGDNAFERHSSVVNDGGVLCSRYAGPCRSCGAPRTFVFELPKTPHPIAGPLTYGGADPSRLLDAGEWLAIAEHAAKLEPGTYRDLEIACAAVDEVLKLIPADAEHAPDDAFWSERGEAVRAREPARFRRARLEAIRSAYRERLASFDPSTRALVFTHTGDAEFPYTAEIDGRRYTVRINDFPAEPLYTLLIDGAEWMDLEDWPPAWTMPAPPQELLELLKPRG